VSRVLLIAHFFAPSPEVSAVRPQWLSEHLRRLGHEVTVLTTSAYGRRPNGLDADVVRTRDLQLLPARIRGEESVSMIADGPVYSPRPHPVSRVMVPDAYALAWAPFAVRAARGLVASGDYDCVISTSPPESSHLVARRAAGGRVPWIADLRDGWTLEPLIQKEMWPTRAQHRLSAALERRSLGDADAVVTITEPVAHDLYRRLGVDYRVIPNGWDPGWAELDREEAEELLDPERFSIVFTGHLRGERRSPAPLVQALVQLAREDAEAAARLELVFAGSFTEEQVRILDSEVAPARIRFVGRLERVRALALQHAADANLVITAGRDRLHEIPAKVFEYLGAAKPILALTAPDGALAKLIAAALGTLSAGELPAVEDELRDPYAYPVLAERYSRLIEEVSAPGARSLPRRPRTPAPR